MAARKGLRKQGQKSLRIGARTQFAIELCALIEKKSETDVIETSVEEHARTITKAAGLSIGALFHAHEGARKLNLYLVRELALADHDEERRGFVLEHEAFFYREVKGELVPNVPNVETLWPKIDEYREAGKKRYWASGEAMAKALKERGIEPPVWPPKGRSK